MKTAASVVGRLASITGLFEVVLGVLFWIGFARSLVPTHMLIGIVFVLAMWVLCALGLRAGVPPGRVAFTFVWSLVVPALGMTHMQILPGPAHWVVQVAHLLVGLVAMGLARRLAVRIQKTDPVARGPRVAMMTESR